MILTRLQVKNYKKYRDFQTDFTEGLTGIIGRNGSGKSTIFNAIVFALYGSAKGEKRGIRYAKAKERDIVKVTLFFEIDGKEYRVTREIRGKELNSQAYLYDGDERLIAQSTKGVTKEITRLIGMNKEAFIYTVFSSQKELTALSRLASNDRKKMIRKLLGLEKIDKIEEDINNKLKEAKNRIYGITSALPPEDEVEELEQKQKEYSEEFANLEKEVDGTKKSIEAISKRFETESRRVEELERLKDDYNRLKSNLQLLQERLKNRESELAKKESELKELQKSEVEYQKEKYIFIEYEELKKSINNFQKERELFLEKEGLERERQELRNQYREKVKEIETLKDRLQTESNLLKEYEAQEKRLNASMEKLNQIEQREAHLKIEVAEYSGQVEQMRKQVEKIKSIGKNSSCPVCTRPLLDEYDNVINSLNSRVEELYQNEIIKREAELKKIEVEKIQEQNIKQSIEETLKKIGDNLKELEIYRQTLKREEKELKVIIKKGLAKKEEIEKLGTVEYDKDSHIKAITKEEEIKAKYNRLVALKETIKYIPKFKDVIQDMKMDISRIEREIRDLEKVIDKHSYNKEEYDKKKRVISQIIRERDELNRLLSNQMVKLKEIEGNIERVKSQLNRNEEQKRKLEREESEKSDYEKLKIYIGNFKNRINSQVSPRISKIASDIYSTITRGKYQLIEVSDEFDFFIYDEGKRYPIERFSGGEVDLANLVLRIAISKTLSELNGGVGVDFLAFDEVFGSQDEERRYEIMEAFHTIKEQYRQIFLISHESEIKDMFDKTIELRE